MTDGSNSGPVGTAPARQMEPVRYARRFSTQTGRHLIVQQTQALARRSRSRLPRTGRCRSVSRRPAFEHQHGCRLTEQQPMHRGSTRRFFGAVAPPWGGGEAEWQRALAIPQVSRAVLGVRVDLPRDHDRSDDHSASRRDLGQVLSVVQRHCDALGLLMSQAPGTLSPCQPPHPPVSHLTASQSFRPLGVRTRLPLRPGRHKIQPWASAPLQRYSCRTY